MTSPTAPIHLVVGAGPIGSAVAQTLVDRGQHVRLVSRSGRGPVNAAIEPVAADASDPRRLTELASDAGWIYNCLNPAYSRWAQDWPPMAQSLLAAAETSEAVLVTASNIYGYGPVDGPMSEDLPLQASFTNGIVRTQMFADALALHTAGRIRMVEVRGADYVGPGSESHLGTRTIPRLLSGKTVRVLGNPDLPHSWTYTLDMAGALVTLGADERSYGRAWHAPVTHRTQREALADFARIAGVALPNVRPYPEWMITGVGLFSADMRALKDVRYQVEQPYIVDDSAVRATFGLEPTPWDDVVRATLAEFVQAQQPAA